MTPLEELIAREYFERNGFYIKRLNFALPAELPKTKHPISLPPTYLLQRQTGRTQNHPLEDRFQLFSSDVGGLALGTLTIISWQRTGLSLPMFQSFSRYRSWVRNTIAPMLQFIHPSLKELRLPAPPLPILLLPGLPSQDPYRKEIIQILKQNGIEALFTLRTLLESLIHQTDTHSLTPDSAISEILRLLKTYDLISPPQLDLFEDL